MTSPAPEIATDIDIQAIDHLDFQPGCDYQNCTGAATHRMTRFVCSCVTFYCQPHAITVGTRWLGVYSRHWTCLRCRNALGPGWGREVLRIEAL